MSAKTILKPGMEAVIHVSTEHCQGIPFDFNYSQCLAILQEDSWPNSLCVYMFSISVLIFFHKAQIQKEANQMLWMNVFFFLLVFQTPKLPHVAEIITVYYNFRITDVSL